MAVTGVSLCPQLYTSPQDLKKEADQILSGNGYTRNGQLKSKRGESKEAYLQQKFEGRMWRSGFRGASRKKL